MKPYKGIVRISCAADGAQCPMKLRDSVKPECIACAEAIIEVLDLDGKTICKATLAERAPAEKTIEKRKSAPATKAAGKQEIKVDRKT